MAEAVLSFILVPSMVYALGRVILAHSEREHGVPSLGESMIAGLMGGIVLMVAMAFAGLMWWVMAGVWSLSR